MGRHIYLLILTLLTATNTLAQSSCTPANARAIDADLTFLAYWEILEVSWLAITDVKKRSSLASSSSLSKRDLVCTAAEECLSFRGDAFCYDKRYVLRMEEKEGNERMLMKRAVRILSTLGMARRVTFGRGSTRLLMVGWGICIMGRIRRIRRLLLV
jgi:hypothetical protein